VEFSLKNSWLFPVLEAMHVMGLAVLVGTIVIVDLNLLGFGKRRQPVSQLASRLGRLTSGGLVLMGTTGAILFLANATRYVHNPAFLIKLVFLALALVFHFTIHRGAVRTAEKSKLIALLSVALWSCVVIAGRGIADFDV
jgi:hypothetical protein